MPRKRITHVFEPKNKQPVAVAAEPVMERRYRAVPLDQITHQRLMKICEARGLGQRAQGAVVRILINKEFEALESQALVVK